ncbi:MAG: substrate-binding domain-containing protein [Actinomycetota bacterium]
MAKGKARMWVVAASISLLALIATACGGGDGGNGTGGGLTGSILVSGSSTVQPITDLVAELFIEQAPDVQISVDGPGTSDGFVLFCDGETDVQDASRAISEEEIAACQANGVEYVVLEVAFDGITVMTNPANPIECLATADLYALMGPESEGFQSWSDANALATELGGTDSFPDSPLEITAPGEESGTYDAFLELAGFEDFGVAHGLSEDAAAVMRPDYQASANDNVILQAIEGTPSALGYVGFAYAEQGGDTVKEVAVDSGDGCIAPSRETIADGSYPLSRSLYIYVNQANAAETPALRAFIDYYVSDDGLMLAVTEAGYVELPQERIDATRSTWESAGV